MLLKLSGRGLRALGEVSSRPFIGRISTDVAQRGPNEIWLARGGAGVPDGFRAYLLAGPRPVMPPRDSYALGPEFSYLSDGDVIRIEPDRGAVHAIYRRNSRTNSLLVTERCNNYCVMCSQPPKDRDDSWIVDELSDVVPLVSPDTQEIGITGGEPALLGQRLTDLIEMLKQFLPRTAVHVLSNGRKFADPAFAQALAKVGH